MGQQYLVSALFEPIRTAAFGAIGANYAALGTPLANPARIIKINNGTNQEVFISTDGVNDHLRIGANGFALFDLNSNKSTDEGLYIRLGTQFYQKHTGAAPASGNVWIETLFAG